MNITTTQMYWFMMLDNIKIGSALMCTVTALCFVGMIIAAYDLGKRPIIVKVLTPTLGVLFVALFSVCVFLPSTKQMAAIMIVPKIANSEKVQTVGNRVYDLAVEWMEELKPNKKGSADNNDTKTTN